MKGYVGSDMGICLLARVLGGWGRVLSLCQRKLRLREVEGWGQCCTADRQCQDLVLNPQSQGSAMELFLLGEAQAHFMLLDKSLCNFLYI